MRTPERKQPDAEPVGKPDYSGMSEELFLTALRNADKSGTVFIHQDGREAATHVLMTLNQYQGLLRYAPRPMHAKFWIHTHVEPEMFEDE